MTLIMAASSASSTSDSSSVSDPEFFFQPPLMTKVNEQVARQVRDKALSLIFPDRRNFPPFMFERLPGPQPTSLVSVQLSPECFLSTFSHFQRRADLTTLQTNKYWVAEKSDGVRGVPCAVFALFFYVVPSIIFCFC